MLEVSIGPDNWRVTGSADAAMLEYRHPDAPTAVMPITAEAIQLLATLQTWILEVRS